MNKISREVMETKITGINYNSEMQGGYPLSMHLIIWAIIIISRRYNNFMGECSQASLVQSKFECL